MAAPSSSGGFAAPSSSYNPHGSGTSSSNHAGQYRSGSMASAGGSHSRRVTSQSSTASSSYTASTGRGSVVGSGSSSAAAHMESTVTKLLVATKQLLEGLTDWSQNKISEEQVSDIYVRLGNCFNACVSAFSKEGISMKWARAPTSSL